jgi:ribosome-binding protein aMBF1 (putative translation factor)
MSLYLSTRSSARAVIQCTTRWQSSSSTGQAGSKKSSWRLNRSLVFPILLASAVSSLAINVRNSRDDLRLLEDEHAAQLSVLHDLIKRLRAGENVPQPQLLKEYERVGIIKREGVHEGRPSMHISWRETLFGRKKEQVDLDIEDRELADIEKGGSHLFVLVTQTS